MPSKPKPARLTHGERAIRRAEWVRTVAASDDRHAALDNIVRTQGVSPATVKAECNAAGIVFPNRSTATAPRTFEILAALLRGEEQLEIAQRLGVSRQRVGQVLDAAVRAGIKVS
jgi:DNA-binding NarL/FixJ family response regulator